MKEVDKKDVKESSSQAALKIQLIAKYCWNFPAEFLQLIGPVIEFIIKMAIMEEQRG